MEQFSSLGFIALLILTVYTQNLQITKIIGDVSLPPNSFDINDMFTINYKFDPPGFITVAITFKIPNQFFAIGFGTGMAGADIWTFELIDNKVVVSDRYALAHDPPPKDIDIGGTDDLETLGYEITPTFTLVKLRRSLDTGDRYDKVISEGLVSGIWATAPFPVMAYHINTKGIVAFPFQQPLPSHVEAPETLLHTETYKQGKVTRKRWVCRRW